MKLLVSFVLLCVAKHSAIVRGQSFAERLDQVYRQKVNDVAKKQQMKPNASSFEKRVQSEYALKVDSLRKGAMGMGLSGDIELNNGKVMGKMKMMMTTTTKVPTSSPSTLAPSVSTITPTLQISMAATTFSPTITFEPTTTQFPTVTFEPTMTQFPSIFQTELSTAMTEQPSGVSTEFPSFEPTISTALPTSQGTIAATTTKGMMMGKMDQNGKGMKMGMEKGKKGMGMGKGGMKGMKMSMTKKTDAPKASPVPSASPVPTFVSTPDVSSPVNPDCAPTVGNCIATVDDLINAIDQLDNDDVVSLCGGTTFSTTTTLELQANRATLCCATSGCRLENVGSDSILSVTGDSVTIVSLTFMNGISDTNGGNVAIFGGGSNAVVNSIFINGTAERSGGNLFVESEGSIRIENSIFEDGIALVNGGGVSIDRASTVTIIGSTFTENAASEGGALYSSRSDPAASGQVILIDDSAFDGNAADVGGALTVTYLGQDPKLMIMNSVFTDNFANSTAGIGAIIEFLDNLELTLEGNVASGNFGGSDPLTQCDGFLTVTDANADAPLCIEGNEDFPV